MKAIAYARYSTDRQSEASIDDQLRVCRDHAAARGLAIAAEHVDEGISGAALGNRPGALRALEQLGAGVLSHDVAAPAIAQARRKAQERRSSAPLEASPWPSEKLWRQSVESMREILQGPDITAAREVLKRLIGPARCRQAVDGIVVVELTTRHVLLVTTSRLRTGTDGRYLDSLQAPATKFNDLRQLISGSFPCAGFRASLEQVPEDVAEEERHGDQQQHGPACAPPGRVRIDRYRPHPWLATTRAPSPMASSSAAPGVMRKIGAGTAGQMPARSQLNTDSSSQNHADWSRQLRSSIDPVTKSQMPIES